MTEVCLDDECPESNSEIHPQERMRTAYPLQLVSFYGRPASSAVVLRHAASPLSLYPVTERSGQSTWKWLNNLQTYNPQYRETLKVKCKG